MNNQADATPTCRVLRVKFQRTARLRRPADQARRSMAALWNDLVRLHKRVRRSRWKWPSQSAFDKHFSQTRKARYPGLPTACIQQAVRKFFGHLKTTRANRDAGRKARYPWRDQKRFATVPYRGDLVHWANGYLTLGGGNGGAALVIPMRENTGEILKAELRFDEVLVTVALPVPESAPQTAARAPKVAAGDPGQRWAWAILAEDGQSVMLNGRGLVSEKIRHAKKLGHLRAALAGKVRDSWRWRKLQCRMARQKAKSARRVRDMNHKITCGVVRECEQAAVTKLVLSQPTGIAQAPLRKPQRQRNGLWEYGEQSRQIAYKAEGKFVVERQAERGTSSTCPKCGHRSKPKGRLFCCRECGWTGHRDLVGAGNQLGRHVPHADVAALIEHTRPKYLRSCAIARDRSSVVETDRSQAAPPRASRHRTEKGCESGSLETTPGEQDRPVRARGRKAVAQTEVVRGKLLGHLKCTPVPRDVVVPRTPALPRTRSA
jgi:putative transposase